MRVYGFLVGLLWGMVPYVMPVILAGWLRRDSGFQTLSVAFRGFGHWMVLKRIDILFALGALLLVVPDLYAGRISQQGLAPLLLAAYFVIPRASMSGASKAGVYAGLLSVLLLYIVLALSPVNVGGQLNLWTVAVHENVWAARGAVLFGVVATVSQRFRSFAIAAALALLLAWVTGSRTALAATGTGVAIWLSGQYLGLRFTRGLFLAAVVVLNAAVIIAGNTLRQSDLSTPRINLLEASEALDSGAWHPDGVRVERLADSGGEFAQFRITTTTQSPFARPTVRVRLESGKKYYLQFWVQSDSSLAGWRSWSPTVVGGSGLSWNAIVGNEVEFQGSENVVLHSSQIVLEDSWRQVGIVFSFESSGTIDAYMGPVPSFGSVPGETAVFTRVQLRAADDSPEQQVDYYPTYPRSAAFISGASRLVTARMAWNGFLESPWVGNGWNSFGAAQIGQAVTFAHAHNLLLHTLYEVGIVGAVGLLAMLAAMWRSVSGSIGGTALVIVIIMLNTLDLTFWSGGVIVPGLLALRIYPSPASSGVDSKKQAMNRQAGCV